MLKSKEFQVQFNENRLSRDTNNEFELQSKEKVESKKSDDTFLKRAIKHMGHVFYEGAFKATTIVLTTQVAFSGMGRAEGLSTPEATALAPMGSDNAMKPPALPDQRAKIIGTSPTEPYVPDTQPKPYQGPTVKEIWRNAYKEYVEGVEAPEGLHQGEAQNAHDGETSSGQAKPDKHVSKKLLSSHERKIATMRALMDEAKENPEVLQSFIKRLNGKKMRERSLLESNSENARQLMQIPEYPFIYTQLTPTDAQAQLKYSQAFQEATQYLGKQPDWNNTYAYDTTVGDTGIIAIYPSEGYSITFLTVNNASAGYGPFGLLGQWVVQSKESAFTAWSTPQGKTFAASLLYANNSDLYAAYEVLVSGDTINLGNFTFSPVCFAGESESGLLNEECFDCEKNLFQNQFSCSECVLANGPSGMLGVKQCLITENSVPCLSVSLSGVDPGVQLWPYMIKISDEVYVQNDCLQNINVTDVVVGLSYVCPPRTCPPGRAYYARNNYTTVGNPTGIALNPGERKLLSNFDTWVYCSTLNETEKVNYISLPTTIDVNIHAFGRESGQGQPASTYSSNRNFHVYDASMYPDLNPYPAISSACGDNDPDCTQLCARHPEANIPSDTMPAQYPEARPPSPAHRHKGLKGGVIAGIVIGGIGGGAALTAAAWCCYRKRGDCMQAMRSTRDIILELCGGRRPDQPIHPVSGPDVSPSPDMPIVPEQDPHPDDRWALIFGFTKAQAEVDEMFKPEPPTRPIKNSGRIPQAKGEASSSQAASESGPPQQNPSPDPWMSKFGFAQAQAAFNVEFKPESPTRPIKNSGRVPWEDKEASGVSSQPSGADSLLNPGQKRSDKS